MMMRIDFWLALAMACSLAGCGGQAKIDRYQVPQASATPQAGSQQTATATTPAASPATPQRMLAVIVPVGGQAWFFKVQGPVEQVANIADPFRQLLDSLRFDSPQKPQWTLPSGWTETGGDQFRYATLKADGLDVSVSMLPMPGGEGTPEYILMNVNRWRGQLQLAPLDAGQLDQESTKLDLAGHSAILVDLSGMASATAGSMRGPFQAATGPGSAAAAAPTPAAPSTAVTGPTPSGGLTYTKPEHWQEGQRSSIRLASFVVERDGLTAEVTVIALGPAAGSVLDNVNRWRGQVSLPPVTQQQLDTSLVVLDIGGTPGQYVRISDPDAGAQEAILAVIVPRTDQTVFFKMKGPSGLVLDEAETFEQFVRSVRFDS